MEITLHLGAHRCASTSFQYYMRKNGARLAASGAGFWGPQHVRKGLLKGVMPSPGAVPADQQFQRARGRILLQVAQFADAGIGRLIVSDENMIGTPRDCLRNMRLYPAIGERMARHGAAFGPLVTRAVLSIRAQDTWWRSAVAFGVARGAQVPGPAELSHIAAGSRSWRDVITDLACALPQVQLLVLPHECFAALPERRLAAMLGREGVPQAHAREWLNRAPDLAALRTVLADRGGDAGALPPGDGTWQPFSRTERASMREAYADDLFWLRAGADGLATLIEEPGSDQTVKTPQVQAQIRGQGYDKEGARRMAQAGRS
ncbi:hypothetical protein [Roseovarius dicentrarchi]|uniref:hypothetical protein n=1 Tax=Roseovarius dicentrarchi TaxID=2250573 RepID=UPI000DEB4C6D|nr:hypothetical protein [Roseovarius dicentrarchi]